MLDSSSTSPKNERVPLLPRRPVSVYGMYYYHRRVQLLPLRRHVNVYLHYGRERLLPSPNENRPDCSLRRYNHRNDRCGRNARCMRCPCLHHVRIVPCTFAVSHATITWNPEFGITPPSCMTRSLPFAPVSLEATGTDMLPWHHFPFHRRGTLFVPPW